MSGRVAKNTTATVAAALMGTSHRSRGRVTHVNHRVSGSDGLNGSVSGCLVREVVRQDRERLLAAPAVDDVRLEGRLFGGRQASFDEDREDACVRAVSRNAPRCRFQHGAQQPVDVGVTLLTGAHPYLPLLGTICRRFLALG